MKKFSLSVIIDGFFIFFTSFFLLYSLLKPFIKSILGCLAVTVIISIIITVLFMAFLDKQKEIKGVKIICEENYECFLKFLYLADKKDIVSVIKNYYEKQNETFTQTKQYFLVDDKTAVFYNFNYNETTIDKIIEYYKKTPKSLTLTVIARHYENGVTKTLQNLKIKANLITSKEVFSFLEKENLLPTLDAYKVKKEKIKINLKGFLKRENAKKFLLWGIVFTAFSWITYFKYFYLLLGSIFLITSIYLRFFSKATP